MGGLWICAEGLDVLKMTKTSLIYSASCFNWGVLQFLWGTKPTKAPHGYGTGHVIPTQLREIVEQCARKFHSASLQAKEWT